MLRILARSLLLHLGLLMSLVMALALAGITTSVVIAALLHGESAAINQAGSLRMQSYRVLSRVLSVDTAEPELHAAAVAEVQREFEDRLHSPRLTDVLSESPQDEVRAAYDWVTAAWYASCRPGTEAAMALLTRMPPPPEADVDLLAHVEAVHELRHHLMERTDRFVQRIDRLVVLLEEDAEYKVLLLRVIEAVTLSLILVVVFLTMYFMKVRVLLPLKDLLQCAERAREGDFSLRARHVGDDELGRLGRGFNVMARDLSRKYEDLEQRVADQTAELTRRNRSLELLYRTITDLQSVPAPERGYAELLDEVKRVLGAEDGTICMTGEGERRARVRGGPQSARTVCELLCNPRECESISTSGSIALRAIELPGVGPRQVLSVPLKDRDRVYGRLVLQLPGTEPVAAWQRQVAGAVGHHLGIAIGTARRIDQGRRMALLEERAAMARELHDSLAQSLSYLKIQVARLRPLLQDVGATVQARSVVDELGEGLTDAYGQLRELLTTFRTQIDGRGLARALEDTVAEFGGRTEVRLTLDDRLASCRLSVNEEVHVLQIVREALANVIHHSGARSARVSLAEGPERKVWVSVEDDGVGIAKPASRAHHYGLAIMRERARSLGGQLTVEESAGGGTRVSLAFAPVYGRQALEIPLEIREN